ncbi:MAG: Ribonuclease [Planctomycetota bacterium]|jgi:ribonuclease PH
MLRHDQRSPDLLRPLQITRGFVRTAWASTLIQAGNTMVLCTASVDRGVPAWRRPKDPTTPVKGWVTAEYSMLPGSTSPRKPRERQQPDGRTTEIQRLIGRSLRAVVNFETLGDHTITVDCDVLQADGGTRTASITGGFIALADAVQRMQREGMLPQGTQVLMDSVAAVSVAVVDGTPVLDPDYREDSRADVDLNVVMTGSGHFIEVQGTAEGRPFDQQMLDRILQLARSGIARLTELQQPTT